MARANLILVLSALVIRLFVIFPGPMESKVEMLSNKADLRNYYWPAQQVLAGDNPYTLWANGQSEGYRADMAPLELAVFTATVVIWNDPRAIQILFALCDGINVVLLGIVLKRSSLKLPFQIFYAFGPLTLYNLTVVPQDKTILFSLTLILVYALASRPSHFALQLSKRTFEISEENVRVVLASIIAAFKWLSIFYLLPLLATVSSSLRDLIKHVFNFVLIVALTHVLWFPSWGYVYIFRATRLAAPYHISPGVLLNAMGASSPTLLLILLALSLLTIYVFFWRKKLDILETITLSTLAGIFWTPDMDPVHLSFIVISLMLMTNWSSPKRQIVIWSLSFFVATVYALTTHAAFGSFSTSGLQRMTGVYASPQMILLSYALFVTVFAFYLWDKWLGRATGLKVVGARTIES